jgi:hypothetical protein
MAAEKPEDDPPIGEVITPSPSTEPALDVGALIQAAMEKVVTSIKPLKTTPSSERAAIAEQYSAGLLDDKTRLLAEVRSLRYVEMAHLRDEIRWLDDRAARLQNELTDLKSDYSWAVAFHWFSFALVTLGSAGVSYASFLPPPQTPADMDLRSSVSLLSFFGLLIGILIQAYLAFKGKKTLSKSSEAEKAEASQSKRPGANPPLRDARLGP